MHIVVIFTHIGNYHIARLEAAHQACQQQGWNFTALQVTDQTQQHPWGEIQRKVAFPIATLMPTAITPDHIDRRPNSPIAASFIGGLLDKLQPDILAIPGWGFPVSRAALRWSKKHRTWTILMSESKWDDEKRYWWKERLKSWLYVRHYDTALVGGKLHREYLMRLNFPSDRIFLGYDVVDNDYFAQRANVARQDPEMARHRQPQIPSRPYFLAVTRFIPRKNVLRLVEAYAIYRQTVGSSQAWDLVLCGSGEEEDFIRQKCQGLNLDPYVHLPGFVTYQQIGDWYGLAQAFIHAALQEQWGLVINEACAAGLPILCSQTVGAYELVHEEQNGLTFDPYSSSDIARTLIAVHQLSPACRQEWGRISRSIIANYTPAAFGRGLLCAVKTSFKQ